MKEERFRHTRKPLRRRRLRVAEGGSFRATEESAATGVQRAKWRDSCTEERCWPPLTSPRGLSAHPPGRSGAGSWGSGFGRITGKGLGMAAWTQPEGVSAPQVDGEESGKRSRVAEQARDFFLPICLMVHEERGFSTPPKRAPETGASCGYQRRPQRWAWDAKAAAAVTKNLCVTTGHYPNGPSREPVQPATTRVQWSRDNFPGGTHGAPQAAATSHWSLPLQACPASEPPPSPRPEWARAPESAAPLTPSCVSKEHTPSGDLHAEVGQIQSWKLGVLWTKKRKGNFSQQPQKQQIKEPETTWCTCICWIPE